MAVANSNIHVDANGKSVAFWLKSISGKNVLQVVTTSSFPGTWSSVTNLSDTSTNANVPSMGNNAAGDTVMMWTASVATDINNIFTSIRPISTGIWSTPVQLTNVDSVITPAKIIINEAGQIVSQWTAYTDSTKTTLGIYSATATILSGTWSSVQKISP